MDCKHLKNGGEHRNRTLIPNIICADGSNREHLKGTHLNSLEAECLRHVGDLAFPGIQHPRPLSKLRGHYAIVKVCPDPNSGRQCHVHAFRGVCARASYRPWRLLCGEKIHRPPSLFSPVLNTSDRWSFQYNLVEGALGLFRVECNVLPAPRTSER